MSHPETRTDPATPRRYDMVLVSRDLEVLDVEYSMEASRAAGSDHGMVTVRLRIGAQQP